ncbi:MAG: hypothetical protein ACE5GK_02240 [Nitrospiria bacterium]
MKKINMIVTTVLWAAVLWQALPVYADAPSSLEDKVKQLESRLETDLVFLEEKQDALFRKLTEKSTLHVYLSLEYEDFQDENSAIEAEDLELVSEFAMNDRISAYIEIEFEDEETEIEQGFLDFAFNTSVSARLGIVLVPFGRYNLEHFNFMRDLTSPPVAIRFVNGVSWSEAAAGVTGNFYFGDSGDAWFDGVSLDYQVFLVNGLKDRIGGFGIRDAKGGFGDDSNNNKAIVGRIGIAPLAGREFGLSAYLGKYDDIGKKAARGIDFDWLVVEGPFEFLGELVYWDIEDAIAPSPGLLKGGFVQLNYLFWFKALDDTIFGEGYEMPTFTAILRYGEAEIRIDPISKEKRWTLGINYRPDETFVVKTEYQWNTTDNTPIAEGDKNGFVASIAALF